MNYQNHQHDKIVGLPLFYIALNFLTRIPSPIKTDISQQQIGQSIIFYPLVGTVIGFILFFFSHFIVFFSVNFSSDVLAALLLCIWVLITGGLHVDGLADSADAWIGGLNNRQRSLDIMKDPYCGPIAVTVIILVLLVKWAALSQLLKMDQSAFLLVVPMLSRSLISVLLMTTPYIRDSGLGTAYINYLPDKNTLWSIVFITAMSYWLFASLLSMIGVFFTLFLLRKLMLQRLGGMTGDTMGATIEITEAVALVALLF
jgi:adenosylcobinamide-GDP ribazoletransferase